MREKENEEGGGGERGEGEIEGKFGRMRMRRRSIK